MSNNVHTWYNEMSINLEREETLTESTQSTVGYTLMPLSSTTSNSNIKVLDTKITEGYCIWRCDLQRCDHEGLDH